MLEQNAVFLTCLINHVGPAEIKYGIQIKRIQIKEFFSLNMSVNSWASNLFTSFVVRVGFNAYLKQCKVNKGFCMILKVTSAKKGQNARGKIGKRMSSRRKN